MEITKIVQNFPSIYKMFSYMRAGNNRFIVVDGTLFCFLYIPNSDFLNFLCVAQKVNPHQILERSNARFLRKVHFGAKLGHFGRFFI